MFRFNLQKFADTEPGVEPPVAAAQEHEPDPAKAFAARLGHEKKKMEAEYGPYKAVIEKQAKASGMEPAEYLKYLEQHQEDEALEAEAESTGKTKEALKVEKERDEATKRLARLERKENLTKEEQDLVKDPDIGEFVSKNLDKIRFIAEDAEVDMKSALAVVAAEQLKDLLKQTKPDYHKEANIKAYLKSIKDGAKPLDIGGTGAVVATQAPKTFEEAQKQATAIIRAAQGK
jgi:hypothetical protein